MGSERLSPFSTPSATREMLERHGLYTKYGLGQNFLVNDDVIRKILDLADVQSTDCVLEVGPGIGTLTAALLQRAAHVTAIEKDADLPAVLADTLSPWADRFTLISADALDAGRTDGDVPRVAAGNKQNNGSLTGGFLCVGASSRSPVDQGSQASGSSPQHMGSSRMKPSNPACVLQQDSDSLCDKGELVPNKLVSNLPYAVAATVVLDYLQRFDFLESLTVMVQKEVADRMTAHPGTKTYGAYTVKLSLYARAAGRFSVAPGNFFPPPHVESAVLRLDRMIACDQSGETLSPELLAATCTMADAAFATRRKTLANSCKTYFAGSPEAQKALPRIFEQANIDPRRRGETLTQEEFISLGQAFLG